MKTFIVSLLLGALTPLAFAPFHWYWLAWVLPGILFLLCESSSHLRASFATGCGFGLGLFGVGASWIYVSIHQFGNAGVGLSVFLTALFVMGLSLFYGFFTFSYRFIKNNFFSSTYKMPMYSAALYSTLWMWWDFLRGKCFTGFPWLYLGYSQTEGPVQTLAPFLGVFGVTFFCVALSCIAAHSIKQKNLQGVVVIFLLALLQYWHMAMPLPHATKTARVTLVQGNIPQEIKWDNHALFSILKQYQTLSEIDHSSDLMVWPEGAIPLEYNEALPYIRDTWSHIQAHSSHWLFGIPKLSPNHHYYNALVLMSNTLPPPTFYMKQILVPFGEFVPFEKQLRGMIDFFNLPMSDFEPYDAPQSVFKAGDLTLAPAICYEITYDEHVRSFAKNSNLIVTVSDDSWFGHSLGPSQHLQIVQFRALENHRAIARATNTGLSGFIDANGQVISILARDEAVVKTETIPLYEDKTFYQKIGSLPVMLFLTGVVLLLGFFFTFLRFNKITLLIK